MRGHDIVKAAREPAFTQFNPQRLHNRAPLC
jgi:hypothetical protein